MHSRTMAFLHPQIQQLVKECEGVMSGLKELRDAATINRIVEDVYRQNEEIQQKIID